MLTQGVCKIRNFEENYACIQSDSFAEPVFAKGLNTNRILENVECVFVPVGKNWREKLKPHHSISPKASAQAHASQQPAQVSVFSQFMDSVSQLAELKSADLGKPDQPLGKQPSMKSLTSKNSQSAAEKVEVKIVLIKSNPSKGKSLLVKLFRDRVTHHVMGVAVESASKLVYQVDLGHFQNSNPKDYFKYEGKLAKCHYVKWARDQPNPTVAVESILHDQIERENIILESKTGVHLYDFPRTIEEEEHLKSDPEIHRIFQPIDLESELKVRKDYRDRLVVTVESDYFENKETTVSIQKSPEGDINELTMYIVDIDYYIPHGSSIDLEVRKRMMSFNLPEKEYAMMPSFVTKALSFSANTPALALAITVPLNQEHGDYQLCFKSLPVVEKCIITPTSRMNYQECEDIIKTLDKQDLEPAAAKDEPENQDQYVSSFGLIQESRESSPSSQINHLISSLNKISAAIRKLFSDRMQLSCLDSFLITDILEKEIHKSIIGNVGSHNPVRHRPSAEQH